MKNKSLALSSIIALVLVFGVAWFFYTQQKQDNLEKLAQNSSEAPFIREHSPRFGDNTKNVTLVEFVDPMCEACAAFHPTVQKITHEYADEMRLVVRYLASHSHSKYAVKILEASRKQNKFKEVLDVMFRTQNLWAVHGNEKPQMLWDFLKEVQQLNISQLREDFEKVNLDDILALDTQDARTLKVRGTPTFFVNGKKLEDFSFQGLYDFVELEIYK
jgi:protein-disulfide isomerase